MKINRRKVVVLGASAVSASLFPLNLFAQSDGQSAEDIIKEFKVLTKIKTDIEKEIQEIDIK